MSVVTSYRRGQKGYFGGFNIAKCSLESQNIAETGYCLIYKVSFDAIICCNENH